MDCQAQRDHHIGKYQDTVLCDVLGMTAFHVLLGRPLQFDVDAIHQGKTNTYTFVKDGLKIILAPSPCKPQPTPLVSCPSATELVDAVTHFHD